MLGFFGRDNAFVIRMKHKSLFKLQVEQDDKTGNLFCSDCRVTLELPWKKLALDYYQI